MDLAVIGALILAIIAVATVGNRSRRRKEMEASPEYQFATAARNLEDAAAAARRQLLDFGKLKHEVATSHLGFSPAGNLENRSLIQQAVLPVGAGIEIQPAEDSTAVMGTLRNSARITATLLLDIVGLEEGAITRDAKETIQNQPHNLDTFTWKYEAAYKLIDELDWFTNDMSAATEYRAQHNEISAIQDLLTVPLLDENTGDIHPEAMSALRKHNNS